MKRWMMAVCAATVASSGCTKSTVEAEADILLSGKVLKEDGQPLAGTLLNINRSTNSSCTLSIFGGLSWKNVKTDGDGTFELELLGADTQNGSTARCFDVTAPGTGNGSYVNASFLIQTDQVQVPTLQAWSFKPTVTPATDSVSVSFQDISAIAEGSNEGHTLTVTKKSAGTIWTTTEVQSPVVLNADLLEDATDLETSVSVYRNIPGNKTTFTLFYQGDRVVVPSGSRVPVSRGASCTYPGAPAPCPLTDGNLTTPVTFQDGARELVIQLSQPKVLRKAVLRQFEILSSPSELVLEGSTDGTQWVSLANLRDGSQPRRSFLEVPLSHPSPLSHVRVRATFTNTTDRIHSLSELSLFE